VGNCVGGGAGVGVRMSTGAWSGSVSVSSPPKLV
jgi:hypothetical protein